MDGGQEVIIDRIGVLARDGLSLNKRTAESAPFSAAVQATRAIGFLRVSTRRAHGET
jgi:hypothetical protein